MAALQTEATTLRTELVALRAAAAPARMTSEAGSDEEVTLVTSIKAQAAREEAEHRCRFNCIDVAGLLASRFAAALEGDGSDDAPSAGGSGPALRRVMRETMALQTTPLEGISIGIKDGANGKRCVKCGDAALALLVLVRPCASAKGSSPERRCR